MFCHFKAGRRLIAHFCTVCMLITSSFSKIHWAAARSCSASGEVAVDGERQRNVPWNTCLHLQCTEGTGGNKIKTSRTATELNYRWGRSNGGNLPAFPILPPLVHALSRTHKIQITPTTPKQYSLHAPSRSEAAHIHTAVPALHFPIFMYT